jgi:glycerophosphoryl diester phosphodiesterase
MTKKSPDIGKKLFFEHLPLIFAFYLYLTAGTLLEFFLNQKLLAYTDFYFLFLGGFLLPFFFFFISIKFSLYLTVHLREGFSCLPGFWRMLREDYLSMAGIGRFVIVFTLIAPFIAIYSSLKQSIPLFQPFRWDPIFAQLDGTIHFGKAPWEWLQPFLGHPAITRFFDYAYNAWGLLFVYSLLWMAWSRRESLRLQFFFSLVLNWIFIGTLLATLFSSAGPCYFGNLSGGPDPFAPLLSYLHSVPGLIATETQRTLWSAYLHDRFMPLGGISAMPSMHVSVAVLLTLTFFRVNRWLGLPMILFTLLIMLGSIHLGWHYAVDGYLSAILTILIWKAAGWLLAAYRNRIEGADKEIFLSFPGWPRKGRLVALAFLFLMIPAPLVLAALDRQGATISPTHLLDSSNIVAHAMGGIDGFTYTNSLDAFLFNYRQGVRTFEVDLRLTADDQVVAGHDDSLRDNFGMDGDISTITRARFLQQRYQNRFQTLDLQKILALMTKYSDIVLVTDTKSDFEKIMDILVTMGGRHNSRLLDRIIPQIYAEKDYAVVKSLYPFKQIIYTLYRTDATDEEVLDFVRDKDDISIITVSKVRFSEKLTSDLKQMGKRVFVHTLNNKRAISRYLALGASGIYTDFFTDPLH